MNKLLIICGPTAVGKTDLAISIAKKYGGEIISADSRHVYKGMDIVTGKDLPASSKLKVQNSKLKIKNKKFSVGYRLKDCIPIWLVDVVTPDYIFNVAEYNTLAQKVIRLLWQQKKLPIIAGGSGLYIQSLISPFETITIPPNEKLRESLQTKNTEQLAQIVRELDNQKWNMMNQSDRQNPRRLIRSAEIALYRKENKSKTGRNTWHPDIYITGLFINQKELYEKIDERVEKRIQQGAFKEAKSLQKKGYTKEFTSMTAVGYAQLNSEDTYEVKVKKWKFAEHAYARRQMTWFRKMLKNIGSEKKIIAKWFDNENRNSKYIIEEDIRTWYTASGEND